MRELDLPAPLGTFAAKNPIAACENTVGIEVSELAHQGDQNHPQTISIAAGPLITYWRVPPVSSSALRSRSHLSIARSRAARQPAPVRVFASQRTGLRGAPGCRGRLAIGEPLRAGAAHLRRISQV